MAAEHSRITQLADELEKGGRSKANNVVHLVAALATCEHEAAIKSAIQALKIFFVSASQNGDLPSIRHKVEAAAVEKAADAEDVYRQWLRRQYSATVDALLAVLPNPKATAGVQVCAAAAVMEAVRSEDGVGTFANLLYGRLLETIVTSPAVKPEYADVRYYTLWTVRAIASKHVSGWHANNKGTHTYMAASNGKPAKSAANKQGHVANGSMETEGDGYETPSTSGPQHLSTDDLARNLFDVLSNVPESINSDTSELKSWCGIAELNARATALHQVGAVAGAVDKNESARARRKRKAAALQLDPGKQQSTAAAVAATAAEQRASWANIKTQKRMFSEAWLRFLQLSVPADIYRKVLLRLHSRVIPNMVNPVLLSDFLTFSLNQGGFIGMLALNGIFLLVTQHGLEYPAFYKRLYNLLSPDIFASKHRAQFFKLADIFLSSGLVPAYTAAAFAKKFGRMAMQAPPACAMLMIAFIHNLIRRHPSCMVLLHKQSKATTAASSGATEDTNQSTKQSTKQSLGEDVYDMSQDDPVASRAVESSLWEVQCLRNHYCAQVAAFTSVLDKDLTDRTKTTEVDLEPLLILSYASLFSQEVDRRLKQVPVAFYQQSPSKLFDANSMADFPGWNLNCGAEKEN